MKKQFRSYEDARKFVHSLKLKNQKDWEVYLKSKNKSVDIPTCPREVYKNEWGGMSDFLGTRIVANKDRVFLSYDDAKKFIQKIIWNGEKLSSGTKFEKWSKTNNRPNYIPSSPERTYKKNRTWISWGDFLGTGIIANKNKSFRAFTEAREFTRLQKLKNQKEWFSFTKSNKKPVDIPTAPHLVYQNKGWIGYPDWLGNNYIPNQGRKYRSFESARFFIHSLKLKNQQEWREYCATGKKPVDIPTAPNVVYKTEWKGIGDWLGNNHQSNRYAEYKSYADAQQFVQTLNLKNLGDWRKYCASGNKPKDIPSAPQHTYKNKGWKNLGDWLGTGTIASQQKKYRSFDEARTFVQSLHLKNDNEWRDFYMSDARPVDIPTAPNVVYKTEWRGLGDWLGTGTISPKEKSKKYWSFEKAKKFVHGLELKSQKDWKEYCKTGNKPESIPVAPWQSYKNKGWISLDDFLGHGKISNYSKRFLPFEEARSFVRSLGLSGENEWEQYCKTGKKPENIPYHPDRSYKNKGWISFGNYFGTGTVSVKEKSKKYWSFEKARKFMHSHHLKNDREWREFSKSGKRPEGIPTNPRKVYGEEWISLGDWLGTGTIQTQKRKYLSYQEAKLIIHSLGLKNREDWINAVKTGKIPKNIPNNPWHVYSKEKQ